MGANISKQTVINDIKNSINVESNFKQMANNAAFTSNFTTINRKLTVVFGPNSVCSGNAVISSVTGLKVITDSKVSQQITANVAQSVTDQVQSVLKTALEKAETNNLVVPVKDLGISVSLQDITNNVLNEANTVINTVITSDNLSSIVNNIASITVTTVTFLGKVGGDCIVNDEMYLDIFSKSIADQIASTMANNTTINNFSSTVSSQETAITKNAWVELALAGGLVTIIIAIIGLIAMYSGGKNPQLQFQRNSLMDERYRQQSSPYISMMTESLNQRYPQQMRQIANSQF